MTTYQSSIILREVNNLITYSCQDSGSGTERFNTMHCAIIKKHFQAFDVAIHREQGEVDMKIPVKENYYIQVHLKCPDLEGLLKSCIEKDADNLSFYQHMLTYYNVVTAPNSIQ